MKKILLFIALLTVSGSIFSAESAPEVSDKVDVVARIVSDLSIETTPLNFGIVGINDSKAIVVGEPGAGSFTIKGSGNTNIVLTIIDTQNVDNKFQNGKIDALLNNGGDTPNDKLTAALEIKDNGTTLNSNIVSIASDITLEPVQSKKFDVIGELKTSANQSTGNYKGAIKVTAKYDSWAADPVK